jgi:acetylglutamate kinase
MYNVNADQMAVACAAAFGAYRLIFLTDVPGVLDASKKVRQILTVQESAGLITSGVATGGMQAKLNAANSAIEQGVERIHIVPGAAPGVIDRVLAGESIGTRLERAPDMERVPS